MAGVLSALGGYDRLADLSTFGFVVFFALNSAGYLRWQVRNRSRRPDGTPRRKRITVLFLVGTVWLLSTLVARSSVETVAALLMMVVGVLAYVWTLFARKNRSELPS